MLADFLQLIASVTLFLFAIHYIYYIINIATQNTMQSESAKYIKKRWKGGTIEPHPTEKALIINYQLEAAVFGVPKDPMLEEKKKCQRIIRLRTLTPKTDTAALAKEVVDKCDLIHKSQLQEVEQIIYYLKNRKDSSGSDIADNNSQRSSMSRSAKGKSSNTSESSIRNVDEYVDLLYEDLSEKVKGSSLLLKVARNPDNLEELANNEAALSALSRILREDWRKSLDLSTNIIYIFFCFSTYTKFHPVIVQYKLGSLCMDVIDYELRRYETMRNELDVKKNPLLPSSDSKEALSKSSDNSFDIMNEEKPKEMEPPRRRIPELKQRPKSGNWASFHGSTSLLKSQALNNSFHEQLSLGGSCDLTRNGSAENFNSNDPRAKKEEYERLNKQLKIFARKQEQLLRVAFYLLLNIAENVKLEEKMKHRKIIKMLIKALDRLNIDLLVLVVTFLKKLSIVNDNKEEMSEMDIVEKLPRLLQSNHPDLIQVTLKLIFNLSFDGRVRSKMIQCGFLPKLVLFLSDEKHHGITVKILYHMSLDDKIKSMFAYAECVPLVTDYIILNLSKKVDLDLIALCINLASNKRNAQLMIERNRLHNLMDRAFKYEDALLMKMIRNISQHEQLRNNFVDFVGDLAGVIKASKNEEFVLECIGILGNLSLPDLDYCHILTKFELIGWIKNILRPGKAFDDLVLDTVIFLGTCACDESCAMLLCKADVIISLIDLLKAKQEDDEIVLQIVFIFQQILRNESTRDYMIRETESPAYLIDLMHDKNPEIRKVCDYCLDVIALSDTNWAQRIKLEKFRNHNSQWLNMVESHQDQDSDKDCANSDDGEPNSSYLAADYLKQCESYNSEDNDGNNSAVEGHFLSNQNSAMNSSSDGQEGEEIGNSKSKSQFTNGDSFFYKSNKLFDSDNLLEDIIIS